MKKEKKRKINYFNFLVYGRKIFAVLMVISTLFMLYFRYNEQLTFFMLNIAVFSLIAMIVCDDLFRKYRSKISIPLYKIKNPHVYTLSKNLIFDEKFIKKLPTLDYQDIGEVPGMPNKVLSNEGMYTQYLRCVRIFTYYEFDSLEEDTKEYLELQLRRAYYYFKKKHFFPLFLVKLKEYNPYLESYLLKVYESRSYVFAFYVEKEKKLYIPQLGNYLGGNQVAHLVNILKRLGYELNKVKFERKFM